MNDTSARLEDFAALLQRPTNGIIGIVDEWLKWCPERWMRLDWHDGQCRLHTKDHETEETIWVSIPKSIVRAMLARIASFAAETNEISPYGGEFQLAASGDRSTPFTIRFTNTTSEVVLERSPITE